MNFYAPLFGLVVAASASSTVTDPPPRPVYFPIAGYYHDHQLINAELYGDRFDSLAECNEKVQRALTRVLNDPAVGEGNTAKMACVPLPSSD